MLDGGRDGGGKMGRVFGHHSDNIGTPTRRHGHEDITVTITAKQQRPLTRRHQRGNNGDINMTTTEQKRGTKHQILEQQTAAWRHWHGSMTTLARRHRRDNNGAETNGNKATNLGNGKERKGKGLCVSCECLRCQFVRAGV